jgi:hypothetical protein
MFSLAKNGLYSNGKDNEASRNSGNAEKAP